MSLVADASSLLIVVEELRLEQMDETLIAIIGDGPFIGGAGVDTIDFSGATEAVIVDLDINSPSPDGTTSEEGATLDAPPAAGGAPLEDVIDFENIIGTDFDDGLFGNNEVNDIQAGAGNDIVHGFAGADTLDGGDGIDTVVFTAAPAGVVVDLAAGTAGANTVTNFENVNGSLNDDTLSGDAGDNVLFGNAGDDTISSGDGIDSLDGGDGIDTIDFSGEAAGIIVDLDINSAGAAGTPSEDGAILDAPPAAGGNPLEEIDNFENIIGTDFNDGLFGNNEVNDIQAGAGDDIVHGFAGDDTLDGGEGTDTVVFTAAPAAVVVDLGAGTATGGAGTNTVTNFENVNGSLNDDTLIGDAGVNVLFGNAGDDLLMGGAGNDTLIGGEGTDTVDGGEGEDTIDFSDEGAAVIVDLDINSAGASGTPSQDGALLTAPPAADGEPIVDVDDIENIIGSDFDDGLFGNNEVNNIQAGLGDDTVHGFAGDDILDGW